MWTWYPDWRGGLKGARNRERETGTGHALRGGVGTEHALRGVAGTELALRSGGREAALRGVAGTEHALRPPKKSAHKNSAIHVNRLPGNKVVLHEELDRVSNTISLSVPL